MRSLGDNFASSTRIFSVCEGARLVASAAQPPPGNANENITAQIQLHRIISAPFFSAQSLSQLRNRDLGNC
jgi:hypothetical protein